MDVERAQACFPVKGEGPCELPWKRRGRARFPGSGEAGSGAVEEERPGAGPSILQVEAGCGLSSLPGAGALQVVAGRRVGVAVQLFFFSAPEICCVWRPCVRHRHPYFLGIWRALRAT